MPTAQVVIEHFLSDIAIQPNCKADYRTDITSFFDGDGCHGLPWKILANYTNNAKGTNYTIDINNYSITDASGNPYEFETSEQEGSLAVTITVPDPEHSQAEIYLNYSTSNQIPFFVEHDECYLTLVEPSGTFQYSDVSASIQLPPGNTGVIATAAVASVDGEKTDSETTVNGQIVEFTVPNSQLLLAEGVNFDVDFDNGFVKPPLGQAIGLIVGPLSWTLLLFQRSMLFTFSALGLFFVNLGALNRLLFPTSHLQSCLFLKQEL